MAEYSGRRPGSPSWIVVERTPFRYERLAEDVMYNLLEEFGIKKRYLPNGQCSPNLYKDPSVVSCIAQQSKIYQIMYRAKFYDLFTKKDSALKAGDDITHVYQYVSECMQHVIENFNLNKGKAKEIQRFHLSFAFVAELALFNDLKKNNSVLKKTARVWALYFNNFLKEGFEVEGGVLKVLNEANHTLFADKRISDFIRDNCIPYSGQDVYDKYMAEMKKETKDELAEQRDLKRLTILTDLFVDQFNEFFRLEALLGKETQEGNERLAIEPAEDTVKQEIEETNRSEEGEKLEPLEVHERLGIVPHEKLLKQLFGKNSTCAPTPENLQQCDQKTSKAIAALKLKSERRKARALNDSSKKRTRHYLRQKRSDANAAAATARSTRSPVPMRSDRVPTFHHSLEGSDSLAEQVQPLRRQSEGSQKRDDRVSPLAGRPESSQKRDDRVSPLAGRPESSQKRDDRVSPFHGQPKSSQNIDSGVLSHQRGSRKLVDRASTNQDGFQDSEGLGDRIGSLEERFQNL